MGCNLSLKLHFLADHLDAFPTRLADWSEQHGSGLRRLAERLFQIRPLPASLNHSKLWPTNAPLLEVCRKPDYKKDTQGLERCAQD
ncbi:hypothetical protein TYRP_007865 [Tyrophagus putrescentiae]|nr:hypothetical protein TYRP_007865 [Tyrophagus putrescentiae]